MDYTTQNKESAKMVIRFFNLQAGTSFRVGNEDAWDSNISFCLNALESMDWNTESVKKEIVEYTASGSTDIRECFMQIINRKKEIIPEKPEEVKQSMGLLEGAIVNLVVAQQTDKIKAEVFEPLKEDFRRFVEEEYGPIEKKITTVIDGQKVEVDGIQHEKFDTVLKFVANDEPVYLVGPAGSGKNVLCKQIAQALGLDFYFTNAVTQEYKLTGFVDAHGRYQETQFYKAFTQGGLFMLDEMDASIPEVLVILNAAIANRYFDFPGIGYTEAHPDFRVVAAGNTIGQGADYQYVGRNQLDMASLDRFAVVKIDYDERVENAVAGNNLELATFCREFRRSAKDNGASVVISYRAIGRLAKMLQIMEAEEAFETCLVKGMEKDDLNMIMHGIHCSNKYAEAVRNIVEKM